MWELLVANAEFNLVNQRKLNCLEDLFAMIHIEDIIVPRAIDTVTIYEIDDYVFLIRKCGNSV